MREYLASDMPGLLLVAEIMKEQSMIKDRLSQVDFATTTGPLEATKFQGQVQGLSRVLDMIIELANPMETGNE